MKKYKTVKKVKKLTCLVDWDEKSVEKSADGSVFISGFANTADKDRVGDVVLPTAFAKTLPEYMDNPVLLYQHDWDRIIGKIVEAKVIDEKDAKTRGLWVKAQISNSADAADIRTKIKEGVLKTFSIGYNEIETDYERGSDTLFVKEVELLEISIVTIPANPHAKFSHEAVEEEETVTLSLSQISSLADTLNQLQDGEELDQEFLKEVISIITKEN